MRLLILALGLWAALSMNPIHLRPPPMVAGLPLTLMGQLVYLDPSADWSGRVDSWFPIGSSSRHMQETLRRQGFVLSHGRELSRNVQAGNAYYIWWDDWRREGCFEVLAIDWVEAPNDRIAKRSEFVRMSCRSLM